MNRQIDGQINRWINRWVEGQIHVDDEYTYMQLDGWIDRQMGGEIDEWMDR